jgi:hypothetical protein
MKIFISWSGLQSHAAATALKSWLPYIFTDASVFVSSEDIRKGKRWLPEISKQLSTTNFGIVCLTHDNLASPWILFEAGALSKLKSAQVCTLLFGNLRNADVEGPLSNFQSTIFNKSEFLKLIQSINSRLGKGRLEEQRLKTMFEKWWPDLDKAITDSSKHSEKSVKPKRSQEELLSEVLEITRAIARNLKESSDIDEYRKMRRLVNLPLQELEFSTKTANVLSSVNILTIGQLAMKTEAEVQKYLGITPKIIDELRAKLTGIGLSLGMGFEQGLVD